MNVLPGLLTVLTILGGLCFWAHRSTLPRGEDIQALFASIEENL